PDREAGRGDRDRPAHGLLRQPRSLLRGSPPGREVPNMSGPLALMPSRYPLTPRNLGKLGEEVTAHWKQLDAAAKESAFLYGGFVNHVYRGRHAPDSHRQEGPRPRDDVLDPP